MSEAKSTAPTIDSSHELEFGSHQTEVADQTDLSDPQELFDQFKTDNCQLADETVRELYGQLQDLKPITLAQVNALVNIADASLVAVSNQLFQLPANRYLLQAELQDIVRGAREQIQRTADAHYQQTTNTTDTETVIRQGHQQTEADIQLTELGQAESDCRQMAEEQTSLLETSHLAVQKLAGETIGITALEPVYRQAQTMLTEILDRELNALRAEPVLVDIRRQLETGLADLNISWQRFDNALAAFRQSLNSHRQTGQARLGQLVVNFTADRQALADRSATDSQSPKAIETVKSGPEKHDQQQQAGREERQISLGQLHDALEVSASAKQHGLYQKQIEGLKADYDQKMRATYSPEEIKLVDTWEEKYQHQQQAEQARNLARRKVADLIKAGVADSDLEVAFDGLSTAEVGYQQAQADFELADDANEALLSKEPEPETASLRGKIFNDFVAQTSPIHRAIFGQ